MALATNELIRVKMMKKLAIAAGSFLLGTDNSSAGFTITVRKIANSYFRLCFFFSASY